MSYSTREKNLLVRIIRKVIKQAIDDGVIQPLSPTVIMKLGAILEDVVKEAILEHIKSGKLNDTIQKIYKGEFKDDNKQ